MSSAGSYDRVTLAVPMALVEPPLTFRPSPLKLLGIGTIFAALALTSLQLTTSLLVYVGAVAWLGWLLSVRIENAQVVGPGAQIWGRRKRIPISQVSMGPPPDWGSDYSIASDATGDRISLLYLSVRTRARLLRALELEHADDTEPFA